ncbi:MAG: prepilin-type N-terminal cleavage/methylation domain-containing protein [Candidatus Saccharimonas sp.]
MALSKFGNRGFTIVELLIVIVVIAILAAITSVSFSGIQQRGRDARRMADLNNISKALQPWSIETGQDFSAFPVGVSSIRGNGWYKVNYSTVSAKDYIVNLGYIPDSVNDPTDTYGTPAFAYMIVQCIAGDDNTRILLANMETAQSQTVAQQLSGTTCTSNLYPSYGMDYAKKVTVE